MGRDAVRTALPRLRKQYRLKMMATKLVGLQFQVIHFPDASARLLFLRRRSPFGVDRIVCKGHVWT